MKFSPIVKTRDVELLPVSVLFVTEMPSSCLLPPLPPDPVASRPISLSAMSPLADGSADELIAAAAAISDIISEASIVDAMDAVAAAAAYAAAIAAALIAHLS